MAKDVFKLLARMRQIKETVEVNRAPLEVAMWHNQSKLLESQIPQNTIGNRIEKEFERRGGRLKKEERELASEYFEEDFTKAYCTARQYMKKVDLGDITEEIRIGIHLTRALELIQRTKKDITRMMRICPGQNRINSSSSYEEIFEHLEEDVERAYIMLEFPVLWRKILPLHLQLREAIEHENYEFAAFLRNGIENLIKNNNPY